MKKSYDFWWPDHEKHLLEWMEKSKPAVVINGRRAYQGMKQMVALQHCKNFGTALDVGSHVGLFSFNLAARFTHVHAFEPVAEHRECFALNVLAENVTLHACALGAVEGKVSIDTTKGSSGDSKVGKGEGDIPMKRLDDFSFADVGFIKIDCEGFEENVIVGGAETIKKWKPTIIVEQKRDMATRFGLQPLGAVKLLQKMGYKIVAELSGDYIVVPQ